MERGTVLPAILHVAASRSGIPQQDAATLRLTAVMLGEALLSLPLYAALSGCYNAADAAVSVHVGGPSVSAVTRQCQTTARSGPPKT